MTGSKLVPVGKIDAGGVQPGAKWKVETPRMLDKHAGMWRKKQSAGVIQHLLGEGEGIIDVSVWHPSSEGF